MLIAVRVHPFPFRTRQLSSPAPKILAWRRAGKIGSADTKNGLLRKSVFCIPEKMRDGGAASRAAQDLGAAAYIGEDRESCPCIEKRGWQCRINLIYYLSALREALKQDDDEKKFSEIWKKCLTKAREFARINELRQREHLREWRKVRKPRKKFLTRTQRSGKINEFAWDANESSALKTSKKVEKSAWQAPRNVVE